MIHIKERLKQYADKYSDGHGGTKMYKVIAWMPLPEPYKEDEL